MRLLWLCREGGRGGNIPQPHFLPPSQVQELPHTFLEGLYVGLSILRVEDFLELQEMEAVSAQLKEQHCPELPALATLYGERSGETIIGCNIQENTPHNNPAPPTPIPTKGQTKCTAYHLIPQLA